MTYSATASRSSLDISSAHIDIECTIRLEHTPENAPDFEIEEYAKLHPFKGLLQIEWVIFVILRAIPVCDGDAIADW
jgi:hypothetical protein